MVNKLKSVVDSAKKSSFGLKKFNFIMKMLIPFNKPHRIRVVNISDDIVTVKIPYRKSNFNHIKGIHACGLATAGEYCAGLLLLSNLPQNKYRIIMKSLQAEYVYQAKSDVLATFKLSSNDLEKHIIGPLNTSDKIFYTCISKLVDVENNEIAIITTEWQIKSWDKVKMKL